MRILEEIVGFKRAYLAEQKNRLTEAQLLARIEELPASAFEVTAPFLDREAGLSIIAEIKKASPSKGIIKADFNPVQLAIAYTGLQVEAISVLTETDFFLGSPHYLEAVRRVTDRPLLRKDFIVEPYQLYEAKLLGADAVLLIVAILTQKELTGLVQLAKELGLHALVEVHSLLELEQALEAGAALLGINNRDLNTFKTSLETTARLFPHIPEDRIVVSESGIHTRQDMIYLEALGVNGVLIGEALMTAPNLSEKIRELRGAS